MNDQGESGVQTGQQPGQQTDVRLLDPAQSGIQDALVDMTGSQGEPMNTAVTQRRVTRNEPNGDGSNNSMRRSVAQPPVPRTSISAYSGQAAFARRSVGDIISDDVRIESQYDALAEQKFDMLNQRIQELNDKISRLDREIGSFTVRVTGAESVGGDLARFQSECQQVEQMRRQLMQQLGSEQHDLARRLGLQQNEIVRIQEHLDLASANIDVELQEIREAITANVADYTDAVKALEAEQVNKKPYEDEVKRLNGVIDQKAREYLALKVEQASSPIAQIGELQKQLLEITRKKLTSQAPATRWEALTGMFSTNKEMAALRSVQRFSKNAAFSKLEQRNDADLDVNIELLELMRSATFALTYFNQNHPSTAAAAAAISSANIASSATNTSPARSGSLNPPENSATPSRQTTEEANVVNKAVLMAVREDLKNVQARADGLIGSQSPSRQFWGKVLMALALAIAATVAAIALMSALGFALPTFLVPYIAYVQATTIVSSVLNLVSTKLAIDLTAAAAVTAVSTAGAFGVFGYGLNRSGAPTSLKRDLDRAAQDLDAAIADTSAMRATR